MTVRPDAYGFKTLKNNEEVDMMGDQENEGNALVVIWTSQDPEVAENMVFMYTKNARARG